MTQSTTPSTPGASAGPSMLQEIETAAALLLGGGPQLISDITTGEGGLQKVVKVGSDLLNLLGMFHQAIAAHPAVTSA